MLLSEIPLPPERRPEIYTEKDFETLALVAQDPGKRCLSFINERKYISKLGPNVSMVITKPELKDFIPESCGVALSDSPALSFFGIHNILGTEPRYARPQYETVTGHGCRISRLASVSGSNVAIGNNVTIEDFVTIFPNTIIGDNVTIRSGARIGGQGFEYKRCPDNTVLRVNHYGGVRIGHDADIHCNTCIDRAVYPWDDTVIGEYTKIDNLVHIAHAVKVGKRSFITAGVCIAGRTEIGTDCWIAPSSVLLNGLSVGNDAYIGVGSIVIRNVKAGQKVFGNPARPLNLDV